MAAVDFHTRVRDLLDAAVRLPTDARDAFIRTSAGSDGRLLAELQALLPHYEHVANFDPARPRGEAWDVLRTTVLAAVATESAPEPRDELPPLPFSAGPYTALELLGRGGMAAVYRATHPHLQQPLALKLALHGLESPDDLRRFMLETEILRRLHHPGIAQIIESGAVQMVHLPDPAGRPQLQRRPYLIMECVFGPPITLYSAGRALGLRERLELFSLVCTAVDHAHYRGIIHRDLKPSNILVNEAGQPKVLDFGVAQVVAFHSDLVGREREGFTGTLAYAAPEQLTGPVEALTPACDVFALGLLLYELLTGGLPRRELSRVIIDASKLTLMERPAAPGSPQDLAPPAVPLAQLRATLAAVLAKALHLDPAARYRTAGQLGAALDQVLALWSPRAARARGGSETGPTMTSRALTAVLRKRIELSLEAQKHTLEDEPPDKPPSPGA